VLYTEPISGLFARLAQTASVKSALSEGVRLACEATGCLAGVLTADLDAACTTSSWLRHDPHGLLERVASGDATLEALTPTGQSRNDAVSCAKALLREVQVPLRCAGRDVGRLILLAPQEASDEQLKDRITGIEAALAVLMAAVENSAAGPLSGVLSRAAFRDRVVSEVSRAERCGDQLSVLHVKVAAVCPYTNDDEVGPWARVGLLGEALGTRFRASDVVGLLAPDRLAILLAGTGRLGARIAARRIEQILRVPGNDLSRRLAFDSAPPEFCLRTFPDDGGDADSLCRVQHWNAEASVVAMAAVSPG